MPNARGDAELENAETLRKKRRCLELRLGSASYRAIADEVGHSVETVRTWIKEMTIVYLPQEETDELRQHEVAKIDEDERVSMLAIGMLVEQGQRIKDADGDITDTLEAIRKWEETRAMLRKQRALMLGLNVPVKVEHSHKIRAEFDEEIEALVASLAGGGVVMSMPDDVLEAQ